MRLFIPGVGVFLAVLGVLVAPLASASTITFTSNTSTFSNVGGVTGLTLTITCGTTAGASCGNNGSGNNNGDPSFASGSPGGLGVQTRQLGSDTNAIQGFGGTGEFLVFTFTGATSGLALTGAGLSNSTTGYVLDGASSLLGTAGSNVALNIPLAFSSGNGGTVFTIGTTTNGASFYVDSLSFTIAPEPATVGLMGLGLAGLGVLRRSKRRG